MILHSVQRTAYSVKLIAFFLLSSALCFAQSGEDADFLSAKKAFSDGFYALAQENLESFLDNYPGTNNLYEAHILLGRCFYYQNNLKKASYEFDIVLNAPPTAAPQDSALYWMGDIHYSGGDFKNALENYQKVIDEYPASRYSSYALYSKAWSYYRLGFIENAVSVFNYVVSRYPQDLVAIGSLFKIGEIDYILDNFENAKISLNNFINKYPLSEKTAESYYLLGDINLKQKKYAEAILLFKRALSISPNARWADLASFRMAQAFFNLNDLDESIKRFDTCAKKSSNSLIVSNSLLGLIFNYEKKGMTEEALKTCDYIGTKYPKTDAAAESYYLEVRILYNNNKLAEAEEACLKSIDKFLSPEGTGKLHYILGWIYLKESKIKDALTEFKEAVKNLEDDIFVPSALCKMGDIYINGGEFVEAAENFDDVLKGYPDSGYADYAQYRLGDIFLATKKYDLAILAYQSLLVNFPQTVLKEKAIFKSGIGYFNKGLFSQALTEFKRLAKVSSKWTDDTLYRFYLANILYNVNNYEEAIEIFKSLSNGAVDNEIALRAQYEIGWCYYRMGRDVEAADSFSAFLKKYPDSELSQDASSQCASILLSAAQNFEKWKMPDDAARLYKRLEELK
jgi:TolA-binding protein